MFWDIVGAILFITIGLPIIIWVGLSLLNFLFDLAEDKEIMKGCGYVFLALIALGFLWFMDNQNKNAQFSANYTADIQAKKNYMQSLRDNNPGRYGYVLLYNPALSNYSVVNTEGNKYNLYKTQSECLSALYTYAERFGYSSMDFDCALQ